MSHTPGPWLIEKSLVYSLMHHGWRKGIEEFKNRFSCRIEHDISCDAEERKCTVDLIAAAPELLEMLEAALPYVIGAYECAFPDAEKNEWLAEEIRAAIKKARGEA